MDEYFYMLNNIFCTLAVVFVVLTLGIPIWKVIAIIKTSGKFPRTLEELGEVAEKSTSRWDPLNPVGTKRYRLILFGIFAILAVLNFLR